ncbi:MAG: alpha/beta fold hydrolase [Bacteroidales bacterium]|nr:alpha/beta fold hydrolase [Bacteroidales bacterium]
MERHVIHIPDGFQFEAGGFLPSVDIVYHCSPREYAKGEKVIWICHALTGNSDPEDWWPDMVGRGKVIDTEKFYVVCVSMIGSPYGECSPATLNPSTGKPYLLDFPKTTVRDMVRGDIIVRKALGIESIDLLIGPSIGGFQVAEWLVMEPEAVRNAVLLATNVIATPYLTAFNESQRMALLADQTFLAAEDIHGGREGLKCARSIALISYRTVEGYDLTQKEPDEDFLFAGRASSYQRYQGEKLVNRQFDAYSYWCLVNAFDSMNPGRGRGGLKAALSTVKAKCTLIAISSDQLFPCRRLEAAAGMIPDSTLHIIDSIFGHDGFLIENDRLSEILLPIINGL